MNLSVEHVLLFLVGAFLAYHMMGNCGCKRVEGYSCGYPEERGNFPDGCDCESSDDCASDWCDIEESTCQSDPNNILDEATALKKARREIQKKCADPAWYANDQVRRNAFCAQFQVEV